MFENILQQLHRQKLLSPDLIKYFIEETIQGRLSIVKQAAVLTGLSLKGYHPRELSSFVKTLQEYMKEEIQFPQAIDICGTGGSGLARINTSTITAFVLSSLGIPIAKHGNKAASGRFGSFDLLETLGVPYDHSKQKTEALAKNHHLAFLFARNFHPAMKHFAQVRSELGTPTIFNLLGPLLNPARTERQMIGVSSRKNAELLVETGKLLKKKEVLIVCGEDGLDEVTLTGKTYCYHLKEGIIRRFTVRPESFGIDPCTFQDIAGGSKELNTKKALEILKGSCGTRHMDLILVNSALALRTFGKYKNLKKAYLHARNQLKIGNTYSHFLAFQKDSHMPEKLLFMTLQKHSEIASRKAALPLEKLLRKKRKYPLRDFRKAITDPGLSLIAEIKRASPTQGLLTQKSFSPEKQAVIYERSGARSISVLADQTFFKGCPEDIEKVKKATKFCPILWKDFVVDEYQIYEAFVYGADAILLMLSILDPLRYQKFSSLAKKLGLGVLTEVHTAEEALTAVRSKAEIIGINHRDLSTFQIERSITRRLLPLIPKSIPVIAESGISKKTDLKNLPRCVAGVLIGTALMKSKYPEKLIESLLGRPKPLIKICGIRSVREGLFCQKMGVDFIGLNFVPSSHRKISYQTASEIIRALRKNSSGRPKIVGVFQNQDMEEVEAAAKSLTLDYLQLSGKETIPELRHFSIPIIKGVSIKKTSDLKKAEKYLPYSSYLLLDSRNPGSGKTFNHRPLRSFRSPFILAGGINPENVLKIIKESHPLGIDMASGIETDGEIDLEKIALLVKKLS